MTRLLDVERTDLHVVSLAETRVTDRVSSDDPMRPHGEIHAPTDERKQSTRMLKLQCPGCGYVIRTTRTWLEHGIPVCCCGDDFEVAT